MKMWCDQSHFIHKNITKEPFVYIIIKLVENSLSGAYPQAVLPRLARLVGGEALGLGVPQREVVGAEREVARHQRAAHVAHRALRQHLALLLVPLQRHCAHTGNC